ncbi:hypothetical protein G7054_g2488 [Neopestalotiopsis clavispora]|nr:hypothetical protein G7054_g2488 [Neopestalotiopsis clavispora]
MDLAIPVAEDSHAYLSGFEAMETDQHVNVVITKYLTKALNKLTLPISEECGDAAQAILTDSPASTAYTALAFGVGDKLRLYPRAQTTGKALMFDDAFEWFEKEYNGPHDAALKQVTLSLVAIHTTNDLLVQTLTDISLHPELVDALREEVIRVFSTEGLKKTSLNNLKLMDSVLKESQRLKPSLLSSFRRQAVADIPLSNGYVIKKGTKVVVDNSHMWQSTCYERPNEYDGYRFLKKRDTPGEDKNIHLVSTSNEHLGFGHGLHACPGRFFAANEIKIALSHLLLKYDWKLPDGFKPRPVAHGMSFFTDPLTSFLIKRRVEELDFKSLL